MPAARPAEIRLTMLSSMAGADFERALDRHAEWRIRDLDLKDGIFGKGLLELTDGEAGRAAEFIRARNLSVYCLSTGLFHADLELGEAAFRSEHLAGVARAAELAGIFRPRFVRLLPAKLGGGAADLIAGTKARAPWLVGLYREAAALIHAAGFEPTIENEVAGSILGSPYDVRAFFAELGPDAGLSYTWDVQNMWQAGTFPSLEVYAAVRPYLNYLHLKGGLAQGPERRLAFSAPLEEASWPVLDIVRQAIADRASPVICLNPSHGARRPNASGAGPSDVERDIAFLRANFKEIAR